MSGSERDEGGVENASYALRAVEVMLKQNTSPTEVQQWISSYLSSTDAPYNSPQLSEMGNISLKKVKSSFVHAGKRHKISSAMSERDRDTMASMGVDAELKLEQKPMGSLCLSCASASDAAPSGEADGSEKAFFLESPHPTASHPIVKTMSHLPYSAQPKRGSFFTVEALTAATVDTPLWRGTRRVKRKSYGNFHNVSSLDEQEHKSDGAACHKASGYNENFFGATTPLGYNMDGERLRGLHSSVSGSSIGSCNDSCLQISSSFRRCYTSILNLSMSSVGTGSVFSTPTGDTCVGTLQPLSPHSLKTRRDLIKHGWCDSTVVGPRFSRLVFSRNTKVHVSNDKLKSALATLELPYLPELWYKFLSRGYDIIQLLPTHGRRLYVVVAMNVLLSYEFVHRFAFNLCRLQHFIEEAFKFFTPCNPLNNQIHAANIIVAAHQWVSQPTVCMNLSDVELMAFIFGAVVMRVGHCGMDNRFLINTRHPYAMMCSYLAPQQGATLSLVLTLLHMPENRFFPSICEEKRTGKMNGVAPHCQFMEAETFDTHSWTATKEYEFYDMLAELIMATDDRCHNSLCRSLEQISGDHYAAHGCLCSPASPPVMKGDAVDLASQCRDADNLSKKAVGHAKSCPRCCAYVSDAHLPVVLKSVLHFLASAHMFCSFEMFLWGCCASTAELYRQYNLTATSIPTLQPGGNELHSVNGLSSVTHAQGLQPEKVSPLSCNREAARECVPGSNERLNQSNVASAPDPSTGAALLIPFTVSGEDPLHWRDDAAYLPILATLPMRHSGVPGARPDATFLRWSKDILLPQRSGGVEGAHQRISSNFPLSAVSVQGQNAEALRSLEGSTMDPAVHTAVESTSSVSFPQGMGLNGGDALQCTKQEGDGASCSLGTAAGLLPKRALQGCGLRILLLDFEELRFPFLAELRPYIPTEWVHAVHNNYTRFIAELPSEIGYDLIVERFLCLCGVSPLCEQNLSSLHHESECSEEKLGHVAAARESCHLRRPIQQLEKMVDAIPIARSIPFDLLKTAEEPTLPIAGDSGKVYSEKSLVSRVLRAITRCSLPYITWDQNIKDGKQTKHDHYSLS